MKKSRIILWITNGLLAATGLLLFYLAPDPDGFPHPLNNLFRQIHGWMAALFLVLLGFMLSVHIEKKWKRHLRRFEGGLHLSIWILLIVSGWLIYYPPEWINFEWIKWVHIILGFVICVFFPLHALRKHKT